MDLSQTIAERLVRNRMKRMRESTGESVPNSYYKKVESILNHQLGSYETGVSVEDIKIVNETPGTITLKVDYEVYIQIPMVDPEDGRTYYEQETEYRTRTMTLGFDELNESVDSKQFKVGDEVSYFMLYGGSVDAEVVKVTSRSITLREKWTAEDTGDEASADTEYELHKDKEGREYIVVWEYQGEEGIVYPPGTLDEASADTIKHSLGAVNWKVDGLKSSARLGDEVTWRGKKYIVISDEDGELQLRPSDMVDDDSFDGYGDSSEDVFLDRWQLKEAFNKDRRMREANKYDPEEQPNLYELNNFLRKAGYTLVSTKRVKELDIPELIISPIEEGYLHPDITHDITDGIFYVDVKEYGLLESSDLEEIIKGYTNALSVLKYLDSLNLSRLEIIEEE